MRNSNLVNTSCVYGMRGNIQADIVQFHTQRIASASSEGSSHAVVLTHTCHLLRGLEFVDVASTRLGKWRSVKRKAFVRG